MHDRVCPPKRMRFSFESRCRLVSLDRRGDEPAGGRGRLRSEPRDRLSALASLPGGRLGGASRSSAGAEASAAAAVAGARAAHPGRARVREGGAADRRRPARPARLDRVEGASPLRRLPSAAACPRPVVRYERSRPGELVHVDIKRLGRFWTVGKRIHGDRLNRHRHAGWQYLHLAIDDHSRLAYAELLPSESPPTASPSCAAPSAGTASAGSRRTRALRQRQRLPLLRLARRLRRARDRPPLHPPRRPQTNGKAEALVKTLLREWAYRFAYPTSAHRARALPGYLRWYNQHRPHSSLGGRPPISRVSQVCGSHN